MVVAGAVDQTNSSYKLTSKTKESAEKPAVKQSAAELTSHELSNGAKESAKKPAAN